MKIYKVTYFSGYNSSEGYSYHNTYKEAEKSYNEYRNNNDSDEEITKIEEINFYFSKAEIVRLLNEHGSHNDNG